MFKFVCCMLLVLNVFAQGASHKPQEFVASLKNDPKAGEKIYQQFCANCHAQKPFIPLGAPTIGDERAWTKRLSKGQEVLLKNTLDGYGAMPARGGCFECSDEQINMSIKYITDSSMTH